MGMPAERIVWTAEMARALPDDGKRYEVLDGELFVSPAPSALHQRAVFRLAVILDEYCRANGIGEVIVSPADIEFSEHRFLQPDVCVVPLRDGRMIRSWSDIEKLLLAAEVISPTSAKADRFDKRHIYQSEGVPEYWIVDLDSRLFERWRPKDDRPEILADWLEWHPVPTVDPLRIDVARYFDYVLDRT